MKLLMRHRHRAHETRTVGAFRWWFCRCGQVRVEWMTGRGRTYWASGWGEESAVRADLKAYAGEAVHRD